MKIFIAFLLSSVLLSACGQQAVLRQQVVGDWFREQGVLRFAPDGTSSCDLTNGIKIWRYRSVWELKDGALIVRVTDVSMQGTTNAESVGSIERLKLISVTDHTLTLETSGQTILWKR